MILWRYNPYVLPLFASVLLSVLVAVFALRHRHVQGAPPLAAMAITMALWASGYILEIGSLSLSAALWWTRFEYPSIASAPLMWFLFALSYTGQGRWLTRWRTVLLVSIPVITVLLVWSGDPYGWFYRAPYLDISGPFSVIRKGYGPWFWVFVGYAYVVNIAGTLLFLSNLRRPSKLYRRQAIALCLAALLPIGANILWVSGLGPISGLDLTPSAFSLAFGVMALGVFRFQLFEIVPLARDMVLESMREGLLALDRRQRIVDINPAAARMLAGDIGQVIGRDVGQVLADWVTLVQADPSLVRAELTRRAPDGEHVLDLRLTPLYDARHQCRGQLLTLQDITEDKLAGEELRQSEQRYRELFATAQRQAQEKALLERVRATLAQELDLQSVLRTVVESTARIFGYTQVSIYLLQGDTLVCQHQVGYDHVITRIPMDRGVAGRVARTGQPVLLSDVSADPDFIAAVDDIRSEVCVPTFDQGRVVGVLNVESTGAARLGEEDLRMLVSLAEHVGIAIGRARLHTAVCESEERYRELVEKQGEGINVADIADNFSFANPAAHVIFGVPSGGLVGRNLGEFVDAENLPTFRIQTDLRHAGHASTFEIAIRRPDGERRSLLVTATPRYDTGGQFAGTFAVFRDITERKRLEEALRASEATYRAIFDAANDAIFVHDLETGLILDLNQKGRDLYGLSAESVRGTNVAELSAGVPPYTIMEASAYLAQAAAGKPQMYEWLARNRSGRAFWVEVSLKRAAIGQHECILAVVRDISERKRLEDQLLQSQKMQIVGQLAGGIAHDFNNLLTAMVGYAEFAKQGLDADHPVRGDIDEVLRAAHRAAQLTAQLLAFSRRQVIAPQVTDLNELLTNMRKMLPRLISESIELIFVPGENLGLVRVDAGKIEQAIVNLVVNARDAMPQGGRLTIETRNARLDATFPGLHMDTQPGEYVMLAVSDTGTGMSAEVKRHLFEPFFTTKEVGKGTGLGLATVYGIVKQHEGDIYVYSETADTSVTPGTMVQIYLARVYATSAPIAVAEPSTDLPHGHETILLAEDEPDVRDLAARVLRRLGYTVLEATNGAEALEISQTHAGQIHLLLSDMVMPQMGGTELAVKLADAKPKVLFMSGHTEHTIMQQGLLNESVAFLQKPFNIEALAHKVREVLDQ